MAAATNEFDQFLKKSLKLFHSNNPNSATEMRMMIDDIIKQRYGPEKMLINTLSQKNLDREKNFPGMIKSPVETIPQPDAIINLTSSPEKTQDSDDVLSGDVVERDANTTVITGNEDFGDLNCCVCNEMMFTASNRLVECSKCGSLYHQECHKPNITDEEASEHQEHNWMCDSCCNKPSTSGSTSVTASVSAAANTILIEDEPMPLCSKTESGTSSPTSTTSGTSSPALFKRDSPAITVTSKTAKSIKAQPNSTVIETTTEKKSKSHSTSSKSSKFSKHESSHKRKSNK